MLQARKNTFRAQDGRVGGNRNRFACLSRDVDIRDHLDAPAGRDNASPQQDDMPVTCAQVEALGGSRGDCREEHGWQEPKSRRRKQDREKRETSWAESAPGEPTRQRHQSKKLLLPSVESGTGAKERVKETPLVQTTHGMMSGVSKFPAPPPNKVDTSECTLATSETQATTNPVAVSSNTDKIRRNLARRERDQRI